MKIVLDTNILISGTFWTGSSFRILQLIQEKKIVLILSKEILEEYEYIIQSEEILQKEVYQEERKSATMKLIQLAKIVNPQTSVQIIKDDPSDNKFIEAAIEGKAEYIITKDKHILNIKKYQNIKIITPEEFLEKFKF